MAVALLVVALAGYDLRREHTLAIESAGAKTQGLSQMLEEHARQSMRRVELALNQASGELQGKNLSDPQIADAVRNRLRTHLPKDSLVDSFMVINRLGDVQLLTAADASDTAVSHASRDYFRAHLQSGNEGLFLGAASKSPASGKWLIPVSIRRVSPQGEFDGILMGTVSSDHFQSFYNAIDAGANGFVTLFSVQGWALARSPAIEAVMTRNWAESPMFSLHLSKSAIDTVRQVVLADGVERIYSYRALKDYPLVVAMGVSLTDGLASWRERVWIELVSLAVMLCALGGATYLLSRQWRERIRTERALKLSQISVHRASLATFWIAKSGRILQVNEAACLLHGYGQEALLSMSITDLDPAFPVDRWPAHWQELREKKSLRFETTHMTRDGSYLPMEVDLNFIEFDGEEYNFAFMRDTTEKIRAEAEIKRGERMLRDAIDAVDEAFVLFDPEDKLVYCNDKYRYLYPGMEDLMVPGTPFEVLVRRGAALGMYEEALGQEDDWIGQRIDAHREGKTVRVQKRGDGQVLRVIDRKTVDGHTVGFRVDITEMVRATQAAQDASRYKSQFLANMSHEIRTPMNAILGLLRLLQGTPLTAQQMDYASKTDSAAKSLLGLLNDILDFSKVEAGKMTLDPQPFRLDRLLKDVSVVLSSNLGAKPIEVLFDIDPALPTVLVGDAMRLQQVLINLGGNAVKFTDDGQVVLQVRMLGDGPTGAHIEFLVQDSGIGITAENQERIFVGFSQAEASTTRRFGGTGLGLAICRRLVELMGGELTLQSTLGQGSSFAFTLTLPALGRPAAELSELQRAAVSARTVLVIDDNAVSNAILCKTTRSWGWHTESAASGAQALALIEERLAVPDSDRDFPFDVVYVDWQMSPMDGWQTAQRIRQISKQLGAREPVIVMITASGRDTLSQRSSQEQASVNAFLIKPVTASMLLDAALGLQLEDTGLHLQAKPGTVRRLKGMRILVVEDNIINQQVVQELLILEGASVSLAANGLLGVQAVARAEPQFDAVLMDIQMPVLDGYDATLQIRGQLGLKDLPIIAMTANAMASDRAACLAAGMTEHVGKPFDMGHLVYLLLRSTGRDVPPLAYAPAPSQQGPASRDAPMLDVEAALHRLSGQKLVYLRVAREFDLSLSEVVAQYVQCASESSLAELALQMHTLKGTAATLGATALSAQAAALEKQCRNPAPDFSALEQVEVLEAIVRATRTALADALAQIEGEQHASPALPGHGAAPETHSAECWAQAHYARSEIEALISISDLTVLERFAQLRHVLRVFPDAQVDALENALHALDLVTALHICRLLASRF